MDNNGTLPDHGCCIKQNGCDDISTLLPIDNICARVQRQTNIPMKVSNDAGRFLCEFIYYQSLFIDRKRTVFIHVPDLDKDLTVEKVARAIQMIVYELVRHVDPLPMLNADGNYLINPMVKKILPTYNSEQAKPSMFPS
jgi:pyroglutamyl-peptidase